MSDDEAAVLARNLEWMEKRVIPLRDDRRIEEEKAFLSHQSSRQTPARQKRSHIMRAITIWRVAGLWVCLFGNLVPIGLPMVHATRPK